MTSQKIPIEAPACPLCIRRPHRSFRVTKRDLWNPGASGANSSSSAQPQRQHVVPGDGLHHGLQRGDMSDPNQQTFILKSPLPADPSTYLRQRGAEKQTAPPFKSVIKGC
ncbi:hypothetical protein KUCAC02_031912 [Chaenocephalus aceratus]|nr:hypothetical protein KUCAC02_031912 [Chaenocephalus aceratus]